jgi:hypothetical protein
MQLNLLRSTQVETKNVMFIIHINTFRYCNG